MPSPFPGMNPYLEHPFIWNDFHDTYIPALREALIPQVGPRASAGSTGHITTEPRSTGGCANAWCRGQRRSTETRQRTPAVLTRASPSPSCALHPRPSSGMSNTAWLRAGLRQRLLGFTTSRRPRTRCELRGGGTGSGPVSPVETGSTRPPQRLLWGRSITAGGAIPRGPGAEGLAHAGRGRAPSRVSDELREPLSRAGRVPDRAVDTPATVAGRSCPRQPTNTPPPNPGKASNPNRSGAAPPEKSAPR